MEVNDKKMYHFHNTRIYNDIWKPNNEIIIDDNFNTSFTGILEKYDTSVMTQSGDRSAFNNVINYYLEHEPDKETYIRILKEAKRIIYESNIFKRELALETVRKEKHPDLPSRKHVIWLCDEKQLDFWKEALSEYTPKKDLNLFEVSVTGNLFKTSDSFLPNNYSNYETNLQEAENYWDPVFKTEEDEKTAEYLFQGKVKILKKLK